MRINIYEEELTAEVKLIVKEVPQAEGEVETFYGLRLFLESPQSIIDHSTPEDDDRNAITLWVRGGGEKGLRYLAGVLQRMHSRVEYERIAVGDPFDAVLPERHAHAEEP